jgi:hypothetical protein
MQGKKALYLFLALLLPVGIFIFLRTFGKNEFEVPAFYQDVAPTHSADCAGTYEAPYSVPDSVMKKLSAGKESELYVIYYVEEIQSRIKQEVKYDEVAFVDSKNLGGSNIKLKNCVLLVPGAEDMIVVDKDGKIRGYYVSTDREDVDRFLLELEILLKKY